MPNWFYTDANGTKHGPINDQQFRTLVAQGVIVSTTRMETDGGHKGQAGQIPGFFNVLSEINQLPKKPVVTTSSNTASAKESFQDNTENESANNAPLLIGIIGGLGVLFGLFIVVTIIFSINGVQVARTKIRHGEREIGDELISYMAKQCRLTKKQFLELIDCTLTQNQYETILRENDVIRV